MTNIEKVKRILDAGHWVKVSYPDGYTYTITSYREKTDCYDAYSYIDMKGNMECDDIEFNCTIEVIQRIPTPYVAGDKVLVLSNPTPGFTEKEDMVGKVLKVNGYCDGYYKVWTDDQSHWYSFPHHCLAPAFEEDSLSGKEAKVTIDGKEYTATLKLI